MNKNVKESQVSFNCNQTFRKQHFKFFLNTNFNFKTGFKNGEESKEFNIECNDKEKAALDLLKRNASTLFDSENF